MSEEDAFESFIFAPVFLSLFLKFLVWIEVIRKKESKTSSHNIRYNRKFLFFLIFYVFKTYFFILNAGINLPRSCKMKAHFLCMLLTVQQQ